MKTESDKKSLVAKKCSCEHEHNSSDEKNVKDNCLIDNSNIPSTVEGISLKSSKTQNSCCSTKAKVETEKEQSCCSAKSKKSIDEHSSCCSDKSKTSAKEMSSCYSAKVKTETDEHSSCCSDKAKKTTTEGSCCVEKGAKASMGQKEEHCPSCNPEAKLSPNKNVAVKKACCCDEEHSVKKPIEEHSSCCSDKAKKSTTVESSCCSTKAKKPMQEQSSCCGTGHAKHSGGESCCGMDHGNHNDGESCCGGKLEKSGRNYDKYILIGSAILLIIGLFVNKYHDSIWLKIFNPSYFVIVFCGFSIFANAFRGIKKKKINSSLLISVAIVASIVLEILVFAGVTEPDHYVFAAAEIAFLMKIGGALESYTVKKSKKGIKDLFNLIPKEAQVIRDGEQITVSIDEINIGDTVLVKANNMIPVDGQILSGITSVDQSNITGESLPIEKVVGDDVFSGTWNKQGIIEVRVTHESKDTSINKLVQMVEEAGGRKAPISRIADKWAGYIVPFAILISIGIFLLNFFALGNAPIISLVRAVTILVVFCPCALALATPTAISAGIGNLAARGILVRSGEALESLAKIDVVAFDKTGTLTKGRLSVSDNYTDLAVGQFADILFSLEKNNDHPIAIAVAEHFAPKGEETVAKIDNYEIINGVGVQGDIDGDRYIISNYNYCKNNFKLSVGIDDFCKKTINLGGVVSILAKNSVAVGAVALSDTIRDGAKESIAELNEKYETVMLTGDNKGAAAYVNSSINVKQVIAELLPEQKAKTIEEYTKAGKKVCMIGDGVNDAPSLALSNCSIAMAELGSELAVETAPISILSSDVRKIPKLFAFSNKVMFTIKLNITISMTINFFAVIASAMGWLTPVTGAIVHNVSSILVVLNSCRLLSKKSYEKKPKSEKAEVAKV